MIRNLLFYSVLFFSSVAIGASVFGLADQQYFMLIYLAGSLIVLAFVLLCGNKKAIKTKMNKATRFLFFTGMCYAVLLLLSSVILGTIAWIQSRTGVEHQTRQVEYAIAFFVYGVTTLIYFRNVRREKYSVKPK